MARSTPVNSGYTIVNGAGTGSNGYRIDVWVEYYIGQYDIENNTTPFTAYFYAALNPSYSSSTSYNQGLNSNFTVNGVSSYGVSNKGYDFTSSSKINTIGYYSDKISHDTDGTKSIKISGDFTTKSSYITGGYISEFQIDFPTIPRSSSLSLSTTSVNVGDSITANISRASSSFTHTVEFYINGTYHKQYTGVGTSQTYTIPTSWYDAMPTTTSCTAYCRITTYSGSTQIGNQVRQSFTVNVPSTIKPTVGAITLDPTDINGNNILVKGKNKLTVRVSECTAGTGSSIKSYTFYGPSINTTTTSTSVSTSSVSQAGDLTYTVTVTDNRGRTNSSTKTITCYDYYSPSITEFNAYRVNSDESVNDSGDHLKITYSTNYASVNGTNNITVKAYYNDKSEIADNGKLLINLGDTLTTYNVYLKIADDYGGSSVSTSITVFGEYKVLNIRSDGKGIAFGSASINDGLTCAMPAHFMKDVIAPNLLGRYVSDDGDGIINRAGQSCLGSVSNAGLCLVVDTSNISRYCLFYYYYVYYYQAICQVISSNNLNIRINKYGTIAAVDENEEYVPSMKTVMPCFPIV